MPQINHHINLFEPQRKMIPGGFGCRIFIIRGDKGQCQIETSTGGGINKKILNQMKNENIDVSATDFILITHAHADHMRGTTFWIESIGKRIPIYANPACLKYYHNPLEYNKDTYDALGDYYIEVAPFPKWGVEFATSWLWGSPTSYDMIKPLENNQIFDLGGVEIKVIFAPGHSPDLTVYEIKITDGSDDKIYLISGDLISLKDMGDGNGVQGLASINNPFSSWSKEVESLQLILNNPPDVLMTMHYGTVEGKENVIKLFQQALEEAHYLWSRTLDILESEGPLSFKKLTKKVIDLPKYISGIGPKPNSMFVIINEMKKQNLVEELPEKSHYFKLKS